MRSKRWGRLFLLLFLILGNGVSMRTTAQAPSAQTLRVGRLTAEYRPAEGLFVAYDDILVLRGGLLQVFAPNPEQSFSSTGNSASVKVLPLPGGGEQFVATYKDKTGSLFNATQVVELRPDDTVTVRLTGMWNGDKPAAFEWAGAKVWASPFVGAKWRLEGTRGPEGVIPPVAPFAEARASILVQSFPTLLLDAPFLRLRVTPGSDSRDTVFLDGRRNPANWAQGDPLFWVGNLQGDAPSRQPFTRTLKFAFAPGEKTVLAVPSIVPVVRIRSHANVRLPDDAPPLVIPQPKNAVYKGEGFVLKPTTPLFVGTEEDSRLASALTAFLPQIGLKSERQSAHLWRGKGILLAVQPTPNPLLDNGFGAMLTAQDLKPPATPEGYCLRVTKDGIALVGSDPAGLFYGIQTLRQLLRSEAGGGLRVPGTEITDYPSLALRGAHLFVGNEALPFHEKLIERIFSRYKMNHLVLECEYTRWDTHPEIAIDFSMPKKALAADIAYARAHFMEVTPLVQSLGHAAWMFTNGQNRDLSEDPDKRVAYCPNREATYKFLFDVYGEAVELFKPKYFHIGHDEVSLFSRFPYHEECKAEGRTSEEAETNLFLKDVKRIAGWLEKKNLQPMLWGDMLLHRSQSSDAAANASTPEVAAVRRAGLARPAVIADWHYQPTSAETYVSLAQFQKEGFPVVATTWYRPENIAGFARAAIKQNALGLLQSTWAGYNSREAVLKTEFKQFAAFIWAAEYAWSGNALEPDKLTYRAEEVFKRAYRGDTETLAARRGWSLDLTTAYNAAPEALKNLPAGERSVGGVRIHFGGGAGKPNALLLAGKINPETAAPYPQKVILALNHKASDLVFVHASLFTQAAGGQVGTVDNPRRVIGHYTLVYADGQRVEIPLVYGEQIRAVRDAGTSFETDLAWSGQDPHGQPAAVQSLRWHNPRPDVLISTLEFRADDPTAAPMLLALTGLE